MTDKQARRTCRAYVATFTDGQLVKLFRDAKAGKVPWATAIGPGPVCLVGHRYGGRIPKSDEGFPTPEYRHDIRYTSEAYLVLGDRGYDPRRNRRIYLMAKAEMERRSRAIVGTVKVREGARA